MTAPDNDLEAALREALSAAASQVEPGDGGLERILVRTGAAPPRSWLSSVTAEALRRVRHWVWRGHWAWQDSSLWRARYGALQGRAADWWRRARGTRMSAWLASVPADAASLFARSLVHDSLSRRSHGLMWVRLVAGVAAAASITAVTVADPPLRAALVQVSATVFAGGNGVLQPGAGSPSGTGGRAAGATGTNSVSPSGSAGALAGAVPRSGRPGTRSGPTPCVRPSGSTGTTGSTVTPSATQSSIAAIPVPSALPFSTTAAAGTGCPTSSLGAIQPTVAPPTPTPTTQAPPTTAPPTTAPPTTAPPSTAPPSTPPPTDTATPTQTASPASSTGTVNSPASGGSPAVS